MFDRCRVGINVLEEFTRIYGNYYFGCIIGQYIQAANLNMVNNMYIRCDCGLYVGEVGQWAHGECSVLEFAHIGLAGIYIKTILDGMGLILSACQFAQAPIIAESAYGLKLTSCRIDTNVLISAGAKNSIIGCNCRYAYAQDDGIPIEDMFDVPADTLKALNRSVKNGVDDSNFN